MSELVERLESRAHKADEIIQFLRNEINDLQKILSNNKLQLCMNDLKKENKSLEDQVENAKRELICLEVANGRRQVSLPNETDVAVEVSSVINEKNKTSKSSKEEKPVTKKTKETNPKSRKGSSGGKPNDDKPIDVRRLDLRVGRVLYVQRHPYAESLYVENIDVGEVTSRVVLLKTNLKDNYTEFYTFEKNKSSEKSNSHKAGNITSIANASSLDLRVGRLFNVQKHPDADLLYIALVYVGEYDLKREDNFSRLVVFEITENVTVEDIQNRLVIALINIKPLTVRNIKPEAIIMCAISTVKVKIKKNYFRNKTLFEMLIPPADSVPGDLIQIDGYNRNLTRLGDIEYSAYTKIVENFTTNSKKVATYKDAIWRILGKGVVEAPSLANCNIQ